MTTDRAPLSRRTFVATVAVALLATAAPQSASSAEPAGRLLQIWFVRHAQSELNVRTQPHPVPDDGVTYPLTKLGVEQANALADTLAATPILGIYSSTRLRAIQTADAVAFKRGMTLSLAPEAVEIDFGIKLDAADERQLYDGLVHKWFVDKDLAARNGAGESFADVQRRFLPFVRELMNRHADDSGVIIVLSHGATLGFMVPILAPNVPADYSLRHPVANTGIIKTELRDGRLFCTDWAGTRSTEFGE